MAGAGGGKGAYAGQRHGKDVGPRVEGLGMFTASSLGFRVRGLGFRARVRV